MDIISLPANDETPAGWDSASPTPLVDAHRMADRGRTPEETLYAIVRACYRNHLFTSRDLQILDEE